MINFNENFLKSTEKKAKEDIIKMLNLYNSNFNKLEEESDVSFSLGNIKKSDELILKRAESLLDFADNMELKLYINSLKNKNLVKDIETKLEEIVEYAQSAINEKDKFLRKTRLIFLLTDKGYKDGENYLTDLIKFIKESK